MGFPENLKNRTGTDRYFNSGVGTFKVLDVDKLDYLTSGSGFNEYIKPGPRVSATVLNMPKNCLEQEPHMHPGGELAYVFDGEYFDADIKGEIIHSYPRGSVVFYNKFSSHRPLSNGGVQLFYVAFDGILFGKTSVEVLEKAIKLSCPEEALEYAINFMCPELKGRNLEEIFANSKR